LRARPEKKLAYFIQATLSHYESKKDERPVRELCAYISDVEKGFTSPDIILRKFVHNEKNDEITAEANRLFDMYLHHQMEKKEAPLKKHFVRPFRHDKPHPVLVPINNHSHQPESDKPPLPRPATPPSIQSLFEKKCSTLIEISTLVIEYESTSVITPEKMDAAIQLYKSLSDWKFFEEKTDASDWDPKIYNKYHSKIHDAHGILLAISRQGPDGIISSADVLKVLNNFFALYSDIQYEFIDKHHIKPKNLDTVNLTIPDPLPINELFSQSKSAASGAALNEFLATYEPKKLTKKPDSPRAHRFIGGHSYFPFYESPHIDLITRRDSEHPLSQRGIDINERIKQRIASEQKTNGQYINRFHVDGFSPTLFPPLLFGDEGEEGATTPPFEYESEADDSNDSNFDLDDEQKSSRKQILESTLDLLETPENKTEIISFPAYEQPQ
jgi:hypothetical protein